MSKKFAALSFTLALALAGVVALLWLLDGIQVALAQSGTGVIRVVTTGSDTPGCGSQATPCQTVQYAVDQAQVGEEIRVAAGLYTGVQGRPAPLGITVRASSPRLSTSARPSPSAAATPPPTGRRLIPSPNPPRWTPRGRDVLSWSLATSAPPSKGYMSLAATPLG